MNTNSVTFEFKQDNQPPRFHLLPLPYFHPEAIRQLSHKITKNMSTKSVIYIEVLTVMYKTYNIIDEISH